MDSEQPADVVRHMLSSARVWYSKFSDAGLFKRYAAAGNRTISPFDVINTALAFSFASSDCQDCGSSNSTTQARASACTQVLAKTLTLTFDFIGLSVRGCRMSLTFFQWCRRLEMQAAVVETAGPVTCA